MLMIQIYTVDLSDSVQKKMICLLPQMNTVITFRTIAGNCFLMCGDDFGRIGGYCFGFKLTNEVCRGILKKGAATLAVDLCSGVSVFRKPDLHRNHESEICKRR